MPNGCCVPKCRSEGGFSFPKDPELKQKWILAVNRKNWTPSAYALVCDRHFKPEEILIRHDELLGIKRKRKLLKTAVPSIFYPPPPEKPKKYRPPKKVRKKVRLEDDPEWAIYFQRAREEGRPGFTGPFGQPKSKKPQTSQSTHKPSSSPAATRMPSTSWITKELVISADEIKIEPLDDPAESEEPLNFATNELNGKGSNMASSQKSMLASLRNDMQLSQNKLTSLNASRNHNLNSNLCITRTSGATNENSNIFTIESGSDLESQASDLSLNPLGGKRRTRAGQIERVLDIHHKAKCAAQNDCEVYQSHAHEEDHCYARRICPPSVEVGTFGVPVSSAVKLEGDQYIQHIRPSPSDNRDAPITPTVTSVKLEEENYIERMSPSSSEASRSDMLSTVKLEEDHPIQRISPLPNEVDNSDASILPTAPGVKLGEECSTKIINPAPSEASRSSLPTVPADVNLEEKLNILTEPKELQVQKNSQKPLFRFKMELPSHSDQVPALCADSLKKIVGVFRLSLRNLLKGQQVHSSVPLRSEKLSVSSLNKQMAIGSKPNIEEIVVCAYCHLGFHSKQALAQHACSFNDCSNSFPCTMCSEIFASREELLRHELLDHKKQRKCKICGMFFQTLGLLSAHESLNHSHKCDYCSLRFPQASSLAIHVKYSCIHKVSVKTEYKCEYCEKVFRSQSLYRFHLGRRHWKQLGEKHKDMIKFFCKVCNRGFPMMCLLREHMRNHSEERPYQCEQCGKQFKHKTNLRDHGLTHRADKQYMCEICGKRLARLGSYYRHKILIHNIPHKDS